MKKHLLSVLTAGLMALGSVASAATWSVIGNGGNPLPQQDNIANFGTYGSTLNPGDSVSVTFQGSNKTTFVGIGFDFAPVNAGQAFEVVFTGTDFTDFGATNLYLSSSASKADAYASGTISGKGQLVELTGKSALTPFYVLYEFSSVSGGSFTGDLRITPIPLPATAALMLAGLGGLVVTRRRKKA